MSSLLEQGIAALRAGDRARARACLAAAIAADPADARAWLWLSGALDDPAEQRYCLERALALDPGSAPARRGLAALEGVVAREPIWEAGKAKGQENKAAEEIVAAPLLPRASEASESPHPPSAQAVRSSVLAWLGSWLIAGLAGASALLAWAAWRGLGALVGPWELLVYGLVVGVPLGWSALLVCGVLLRISGRWLGGRAGGAEVRAALGWALVPAAGGLLLWAVQLALLPAASFAGQPADAAQGLLVRALAVIHGALWVSAGLASAVTLARAHGITPARAAGSWLLALLIVAAAVVVVFGGSALVITLRGG